MPVSAVLRLGYLLALIPIGTKEHAKAHRRCLRIGETICAPLLKSKNKLLLVLLPFIHMTPVHAWAQFFRIPCTEALKKSKGVALYDQ